MLVTLSGMVMLVRPLQHRMRNPDAGDAVADVDARQASAAIECVIPDAGDAVGNVMLVRPAVIECVIPDAGDAAPVHSSWNLQWALQWQLLDNP